MLPIFSYGTLMYQPLWLKVVNNHSLVPSPAVLDGFSRRSITNSMSCSLVPAAGGHVSGMLYANVGESDLDDLDQYLGELFERVQILVVTPIDSIVAYTYLVRPEHHYRIENDGWDQRQFEHYGLQQVLASSYIDTEQREAV